MNLRSFWNKTVRKYVDVKDKIVRTVRFVANKLHTALIWVETKLISFENSVVFFIGRTIDFVVKLRKVIGIFIETYRINKIVKLENKVAKIKEKIAYL